MKILFLCHRFPYPPNRGGRIRAFNTIKQLGRAHEITLATLLRSDTDDADIAALDGCTARRVLLRANEANSWLRTIASLPTATPSSVAYFDSPRFARSIEREFSLPYDLVIAHWSSMAPYVAHAHAVKVLDFGDMDSQKWLRVRRPSRFPVALGYPVEGRKLQRAEARAGAPLRALHVHDARRVGHAARLRHGPTRRLVLRTASTRTTSAPRRAVRSRTRSAFSARMDYYPNQDAMHVVLRSRVPRLRARRPGLTLPIIGAARRARVRRLADGPGSAVTGPSTTCGRTRAAPR